MSWLLLTFLGILIFSSNNILHRVLMKDAKSDPYAQTIVFFGLAGIFALVFSLIRGNFYYHVTFHQVLLFIPLTVSCLVGPILLFKSFKLIDASENAILQSSQKLWIVLGSFLFLQEIFTWKKIIGTVIIILGIAIAEWRYKRFQFNEGALLVFIASIFYAIMNIISFYLVRDIDAISFLVYVYFLPVIVLFLIRPKTLKQVSYYFKPKYSFCVTILSLNDVLGSVLIFYAYQIGRNAAQIAPLMGLITIISVMLGIILLNERKNIPNKILGAFVTVVGALLVL